MTPRARRGARVGEPPRAASWTIPCPRCVTAPTLTCCVCQQTRCYVVGSRCLPVWPVDGCRCGICDALRRQFTGLLRELAAMQAPRDAA